VDGNTYQVASSGGTTSWYGRIDNVPKSLTSLTVTYAGANTATCNQSVLVYNWAAGAWSYLDTRSVGPTTATVTADVSGTLAGDVSGSGATGSVAVAIVCSGAATAFTAQADQLKVTYTP
jgi:hypothetical protein